MRNWTKEDKAIVNCIIADVEDCFDGHIAVLDKDGKNVDSDEGTQIFKQELAFLKQLVEEIEKDIKGEPLQLEIGQKYTCLQDILYEDVKKNMFTKGNVYIVIRDVVRGLPGLMSNDGIARTVRDIPAEMNTEYFELLTKE